MRRLDLNAKTQFLPTFKFWIFKWWLGRNFEKFRFLNSAPNYSTVKNIYMRKQDLNTEKNIFGNFGIFDLKGEN